MKILKFLWHTVCLAGWNWAMREIDPMHPDVIKVRRGQIKHYEALRRVFA